MAAPAQTGLLTAIKAKLSQFDGLEDCRAVTEWSYEEKETFELIVASGEGILEEYIICYEARLFKGEELDWWISL